MTFKDLSYRKPKGTVKGNVKKQGSGSSGKNIQRPPERVQKAKGDGSADASDG